MYILFSAVLHLCTANDAPIIGILTQPPKFHDVDIDTYIAGSYVKFLESAGARVLPIWLNQSLDYYERVVNYTNGVLFPGGDAPLHTPGGFGETATRILHLAKVKNENGIFYPLWGTCLGMEAFPFAEIGRDIRTKCLIPDGAYSINFTEDFRSSRLFSNIPSNIFNILLTQNVTYNAHAHCITEDSLAKVGLDTHWHVLSTNQDVNNLKFISTMEHKKYPFYGTQFHPEKNAFEFKDNQGFPHSRDGVLVMQYFSNYFMTEARKSNNRFPSRELEAKSLIYNYCPQFTGLQDKYYYQIYGFVKKDYINNILQ